MYVCRYVCLYIYICALCLKNKAQPKKLAELYCWIPGHDAHMLYTLSAVQICLLFDALDVIEVDRVVAFVARQQVGTCVGVYVSDVCSRLCVHVTTSS